VRLLGVVEYDGTDFAGFQLQARHVPPPRTVQHELELALATCTGEATRVIGSGRTDAGVHARGQAVHFDTTSSLAGDLPRLRQALNAHLPGDVKVRSLHRVPATLHARYSARSRAYCYRVYASPVASPLLRRVTHHVRAPLSVARMAEGAGRLVGTHDFVAFAAQHGGGRTVREVFRAGAVEAGLGGVGGLGAATSGDAVAAVMSEPERAACASSHPAAQLIEIWVEASGFLRHMMRRLAGTLIRVGLGRLEPSDVAAILASRDKALAGPTAPARGLCLESVVYDAAGFTGVEQEEQA
jgi:tRNA pseudouridine38-40 synthase